MDKKLLIVDDEPRIYQALRRALHREKWVTLYAESGDAGLQLLEKEVVDIVIADENMPGMNGSQMLSLVRQRWPDVIRMMLTGDPRMDVIMKAVNRGEIYRFFTKPCNEAELIIAVRDALQTRRLKQESLRLLATVQRQARRIAELEGRGSESSGDDGAADPQDGEASEGTLSLDDFTSQSDDGDLADRNFRGSSRVTSKVIDLGGAGSDVDSLLDDIRDQLDDIMK